MKVIFGIFITLVFGFSPAHGAELGYPSEKVEIDLKKTAVIKNNFCFPVVVYALNQDFDLSAGSYQILKVTSWGLWHWMPGLRSAITRKDVYYPLKNKTNVDAGLAVFRPIRITRFMPMIFQHLKKRRFLLWNRGQS